MLPTCCLYNEYGPTEATVWCTVWKASAEQEPVLIGRPIPGAEINILNADRRPVPIGVPGELYVGGPGVAPGYLNAERFADNVYPTGDRACWLENGELLFLGRVDEQIKVRGHRIEPGEIEAALMSCPGVQEAVAVSEASLAEPGVEALVSAMSDLDPVQIKQMIDEACR